MNTNTRKATKAFIGFLIAFLVIDAIWIAVAGLDLYEAQVGSLLSEQPRMLSAGIFYLGYAAGAVYLTVVNSVSWRNTLVKGAVLGGLAYGTYGVTNYAMLAGWTYQLFIIDTIWGAFVTGTSALVGFICHKS
ncbi:MAG: DUF2177 family protein [Gammaproteobacteria bacterium]|nr:DUF2177 family protein [Gammaproteobacteria bacterium]